MKSKVIIFEYQKLTSFALPVFLILTTIGTFLVSNNPFFWDTIQLASKQAHFFFENGFNSIILPENIDSGHPPFFGMYLAAVWKWFGKTLPVSHFAMLPFLWGIVYLLYKIGSHFGGKQNAFWFLLLVSVDPVFAAQSILVSPDVVLVFFFLLGFWSILSEKKSWLVISVLGLAMISLRGMMVGVILFLFEILHSKAWHFLKVKGFKNLSLLSMKKLLPYLPGGVLGLFFLLYHHHQTGWIGYHPESPWAPCFEKVDFSGFVKNLGILGWRMLDFGRVFVWLVLGWGIFYLLKRKNKIDDNLMQILILLSTSILMLCPSLVIHKALLAHRYILPVFLLLNLFCFYLIFKKVENRRLRNLFFGIAFIGLLTGNFWIYPDKVAQGWDSTLAHIPYYELRGEMIDFMEENDIPFSETGTGFPNRSSFKETDLSERAGGMPKKELEQHSYIFYSNIMNDFSDSELEELKDNWSILKKLEKGGIKVILFQK